METKSFHFEKSEFKKKKLLSETSEHGKCILRRTMLNDFALTHQNFSTILKVLRELSSDFKKVQAKKKF